MKLYKKFLKRIENGEPNYCNETLAKDLQAIAEKHQALQLLQPDVISSVECKHRYRHTEVISAVICTDCNEILANSTDL